MVGIHIFVLVLAAPELFFWRDAPVAAVLKFFVGAHEHCSWAFLFFVVVTCPQEGYDDDADGTGGDADGEGDDYG